MSRVKKIILAVLEEPIFWVDIVLGYMLIFLAEGWENKLIGLVMILFISFVIYVSRRLKK